MIFDELCCVQAPLICDYQTATYTITIEDLADSGLHSLTRQSTYTGSNRFVVELFTSGLKIDHNYTLLISVVENNLKLEVSNSVNFSMSSLILMCMHVLELVSHYLMAVREHYYLAMHTYTHTHKHTHTHTHTHAHTHTHTHTHSNIQTTATLFRPTGATGTSSGMSRK